MFFKNLINEITYEMDKKNISKKEQKYILKYLELNIELFNFLDIKKIVERILENFSGIYLNPMNFIFGGYGEYNPINGKIYLSPRLYLSKERKYRESVIFHELDHCACTPVEVKKGYLKFKDEIKNKYKIIYKIVPDFIFKEIFLKIHYNGFLTGIISTYQNNDYKKQKLIYGIRWDNYLNEGITSYKQIKYSELAKVKFHYKNDFYKGARIGIECIGEVIGIDNMINFHFNNNLKDIEKKFYKKTNVKIETLMIKCLEYDKTKSKRRKKEIIELIENLKYKGFNQNNI